MAELSFSAAITEAIKHEMRRDPSVFLMGDSVRSGIYGVTGGLHAEFGDDRVLDCPASETGFVGAAVGAAAAGMRPIVTSQCAFMWVAMDQFVNQVAKMKYMFGGQATLPVVYRMGISYANSLAAHHTDRPHPIYMNIPGLKIVMPTTPADALGLFKTAVREDDPVLFCEDSTVMRTRGEVPEGDHTVPLGVAAVRREGTDVTIVAVGGMVQRSLAAAEQLAAEGISVEVIDPRSLVPLDTEAILASVAKTGRFVAVDSANKTCSVASELCALVAQEAFRSLKGPVQRVASLMVHPPFSPVLEKLVYPDEGKIVEAVRRTMG
ncbi:MAG: alpha-ketoacid dehydrogenase subunit beta [Dehalococcoidia bacterium]|nr:alpha-ketoacid dehydrogenase subunit beta [Dehalococcoidia bacterium]